MWMHKRRPAWLSTARHSWTQLHQRDSAHSGLSGCVCQLTSDTLQGVQPVLTLLPESQDEGRKQLDNSRNIHTSESPRGFFFFFLSRRHYLMSVFSIHQKTQAYSFFHLRPESKTVEFPNRPTAGPEANTDCFHIRADINNQFQHSFHSAVGEA